MAAFTGGDAGAQAAKIALRIGSNAADAISFAAGLGEELPFIGPVLTTLKAIREKVETVKNNREGLTALEVRCTYVTACVVVKCRQNSTSEIDVTPLEACVEAIRTFVERCSGRGKVRRVWKASSDKDEIAGLNARVDCVTGDLGLAGIAVLEGKADEMKAMLRDVLKHLHQTPVKMASVPKGTPTRKSWHVDRRHVTQSVLEALRGNGGPCLVGLAGDSGAGKTTAASEIVRSTEMREAFCDGIIWLPVNVGAKYRLESLMQQLADMLFEDVGNSVGRRPVGSEDFAAYIKQRIGEGHGGNGLKCLVVADNVWEAEVASKLLQTGMWVLLSTRSEELVSGAHGKVVGVDELSRADAEALLRKASELAPEIRLPDAAGDLIELCGRVAMDLAFVGRWSTVRGRDDRGAWLNAARKVQAEMDMVGVDRTGDTLAETRTKRRKAILQAGFNSLASAEDDERVPWLYLSLAILPDGHAFSVKDAAILLYDLEPGVEDVESAAGVVDVLERWSVLRSTELSFSTNKRYHMHDAHSGFARERLKDRIDVRRPALERWVKYMSSLDALRSIKAGALKGLWRGVEAVGGSDWNGRTCPYVKALDAMDESDPLLWTTLRALAEFQGAQDNYERASTTWRRLLEVQESKLGKEHEAVLQTVDDMTPAVFYAGRSGEVVELLRHCLAIQEAKLGPEENQVVYTRHALGVCLRADNRLEEAEELLRCCLTILEAKLGPDDSDVANMLHHLGMCIREAGRLGEAEELLRRSLTIQEAGVGSDDVGRANTLTELGSCVREAGRLEEAEKLFRCCLAIKEIKLGPEDVQVATTLHALGQCIQEAGRLEEAEKLLRRCLAIREAKLGPEDVQVATTLYRLGQCVQEAGHLEEAEKLLRRSLAITEVEVGPDDVQVATITLYQLGQCVQEAGRLEEAEKLLRRCLAIREAKLGPEDVQVATTLYQLGQCVQEAGRLEEAEKLLRRCLAVEEAKLGPEDVQVATTLHELGQCVQEAGRLEEAEQLFRRCLAIEEAKLGPEDVKVADTLHDLGGCVREAGRLEEAEKLFRRSLAITEVELGPEHTHVAYTLHRLGVCKREAGRLEEAEQLLRRCLAITEVKLGPEHKDVATTLHHLGVCKREAGRLEEAEQLFRRSLAITEIKLGPEHKDVATTLHHLGVCKREAGRLEEAEKLLRRSLAIREVKLDSEDARVADTLHHLGVCVLGVGRVEEAEILLRRCLAIQQKPTCRLRHYNVSMACTMQVLEACEKQREGKTDESPYPTE